MISGRERLVLVQRLCNEVSEVFIDGTFKYGAKSFLNVQYTLIMQWTLCTFLSSYYCLENQFTIACGELQYVIVVPWVVRLYVEILHELYRVDYLIYR